MQSIKREQLHHRLVYIDRIIAGCEQLIQLEQSNPWSEVHQFAQDRILHLTIEIVTDIGSLLIDAFELREASSYGDIIEIMNSENIFDTTLGDALFRLAKLRKSLVQDYASQERSELHPYISQLPIWLSDFRIGIHEFIDNENKRWGYPRLG
jgi:uncharacterized protein YutE (UPF0331/DUF86 family)